MAGIGKGSEGKVRLELSQADPALAKGACEDGDSSVLRDGYGERGRVDVMGLSEWLPAFPPPPRRAQLLPFLLRQAILQVHCTAFLSGTICPVVHETTPVAGAVHEGKAEVPSLTVYRRLSRSSLPSGSGIYREGLRVSKTGVRRVVWEIGSKETSGERSLGGSEEAGPPRSTFGYGGDACLRHGKEDFASADDGTEDLTTFTTEPTARAIGTTALILWRLCVAFARPASCAVLHALTLLRHVPGRAEEGRKKERDGREGIRGEKRGERRWKNSWMVINAGACDPTNLPQFTVRRGPGTSTGWTGLAMSPIAAIFGLLAFDNAQGGEGSGATAVRRDVAQRCRRRGVWRDTGIRRRRWVAGLVGGSRFLNGDLSRGIDYFKGIEGRSTPTPPTLLRLRIRPPLLPNPSAGRQPRRSLGPERYGVGLAVDDGRTSKIGGAPTRAGRTLESAVDSLGD